VDASVLLWIPALLLVAAGIAGLVLPALPGAPLLFAGLVCAAWAEDFAYIGAGWLGVLGALAALSYPIDLAAGAVGARRFGASGRAVVGAALGALVGLFFGLPGILLGPFLGAVLGELSGRRDLRQAGRSGLGATLGLALGVAAKLTLAFAMLGIFALVRFSGAAG
jgi:uncharacterized protein YqgC (DUF456 family)